MNNRQLAQILNTAHATRSWRQISQQDYFGMIPAGTLARIAKTNGDYVPDKWRPWLGLGRTRAQSSARRLADMSTTELRWALEHRVEL